MVVTMTSCPVSVNRLAASPTAAWTANPLVYPARLKHARAVLLNVAASDRVADRHIAFVHANLHGETESRFLADNTQC
jgi:hypothetical protein